MEAKYTPNTAWNASGIQMPNTSISVRNGIEWMKLTSSWNVWIPRTTPGSVEEGLVQRAHMMELLVKRCGNRKTPIGTMPESECRRRRRK